MWKTLSGFFDGQSSKQQHLFETEMVYNIINVFTVTFDQFNASLLNKRIKQYMFCLKEYAIFFKSEFQNQCFKK